ncbi:hypothetical protein AU381_10800 [Sinorhizobium glycinis]|uniref:Uncharacterized protein n=1 Tax=Sinorhizobium glycinis TaxID=1472378 RepID=A0A178XXH2_9HYPH|nr:hypothetical protein AU381_10800 [Sinorhizobium glycinis]
MHRWADDARASQRQQTGEEMSSIKMRDFTDAMRQAAFPPSGFKMPPVARHRSYPSEAFGVASACADASRWPTN